MRWIPLVLACRVALAVLLAGPAQSAPAGHRSDRPNVVVILWNDPAPERFGLPGKNRDTPRLDALLASGARFPNGSQVCDRGRPTAAVLLTGLMPHQSGACYQLGGRALSPESTLSHRLRAAGYAGLHVGKFREGDLEVFGFEREVRTGIDSGSDSIVEFVREFGGEQPLFLWWAPEIPNGQGVEDLDAELGKLVDALAAPGLRSDTLFAFVTNGSPRGYEFSVRECSAARMRNPVALVWKDHIQPAELAERATPLDLFPTLLDFLGIAAPPDVAGRSLRPLLAGEAWEDRPVGAEYFERQASPGSKGGHELGRDLLVLSLLDGPWKYSLFLEDIGVKIDHATELVQIEYSAGDQVLIDLEADPREENDLFSDAEQAQRLSAMREAVLEWWRSTGGPELSIPFMPPRLGPAPKEAHPNIVLIVADDMDYGHLGFMGNTRVKTPTLDELAHTGVVFPVAYVPMSRCRPTLATLLSGRWPQQTGIYENSGKHVLTRRDSLPNLLKAAGYATFVGGKFWEGSHLSMGFIEPKKIDTVFQTFVRENQDELFDFIDRYHEERPFFVWWAPMLPHVPFNPPERHQLPYRDTAIPVPDTVTGDAQAYQEAERTLYAMDSWLDEGLAQLRAKLAQAGELEDTLFVFLIDNGYSNDLPSKGTTFEKGLRTPVFFSWPKGIQGGRSRPELVYSIDLYRTILEYAGVPAPEQAGGMSLKALLDGQGKGTRDALYGAAYYYKDRPGQQKIENDVYALYARTERWKFVLYLRTLDPMNFHLFHGFAPFPARQRGDRDLFDLQQDPQELHNLADDSSHTGLMDELQQGCLEWWLANGGVEIELPGDEAVGRGKPGPGKKRGKKR